MIISEYTEYKNNRILIIIVWTMILIEIINNIISGYYTIAMVIIPFSILFLAPTILFLLNRWAKTIKYQITFCSIIIIQAMQYFDRQSSFAYIIYTLAILITTSIYFDTNLTKAVALLVFISSFAFPLIDNKKFISLFSNDVYASYILCLLAITFIILKQVSTSRGLIDNNQNLYDKAIHDHLTGAYNRSFYDNYLNESILKTQNSNKDISIIIIDLDNFKNINDIYGHQKGDEVLRDVVKTSWSCIRKTDILTRNGGEEFGIILENAKAQEAFDVAEKIRVAIENYGENMNFNISASLGISQYQSGETSIILSERADKAMYISKLKGKNRCTLL